MIQIRLPWPPSVNHYWVSGGSKRFLSPVAKRFRSEVASKVRSAGSPRFGLAPLEMRIKAYPPDRRKRDLDNLLKAILDALAHAKVYKDDNQIYLLKIERCEVAPEGFVEVEIKEKT